MLGIPCDCDLAHHNPTQIQRDQIIDFDDAVTNNTIIALYLSELGQIINPLSAVQKSDILDSIAEFQAHYDGIGLHYHIDSTLGGSGYNSCRE